MTRIGTLLGTAALALAFGAATTLAQTPSAAPSAAPAATAKAAPVKGKLKTATTAVGKQCSAEADAKGVHGKERKKMRADCKKRLTAKP